MSIIRARQFRSMKDAKAAVEDSPFEDTYIGFEKYCPKGGKIKGPAFYPRERNATGGAGKDGS